MRKVEINGQKLNVIKSCMKCSSFYDKVLKITCFFVVLIQLPRGFSSVLVSIWTHGNFS